MEVVWRTLEVIHEVVQVVWIPYGGRGRSYGGRMVDI